MAGRVDNLLNNITGDWVVDNENKNSVLKIATDYSTYDEAFTATPEYINGIMDTLLLPNGAQKTFNETKLR